ncbi:hypothetical protein SAMN05428985_104507 [Nocardioides sp. YR527]|uniref:hypothetical protein n=1 Tax=Nocardioides sp. YR527 TaxID=1881028 RepID=UPI0008901028|nr:hypothetical protein [Nocardioides sp. YR527]SDK56150.1 hypothetical protein SAMN05428985_104507 [Nocardioides sp. YR527]
MSTSTQPPGLLSAEQLGELLELTKQADSVELKMTVPKAERPLAVAALGLDPLDAQIRQVYFFDTADLALNQRGLVVRARRIQGRNDDSVVKVRPVNPTELSAARKSKNLTVEVDAMPGGFVCSASMKATRGRTDVKEVAAGTRPIHKLYTKEQQSFFRANAASDIELDDLVRLGPITVLKQKLRPQEYAGRLVAELWFYPDGARVLELSSRCAPVNAFQVAAELKAFLAGRGLEISGDQQTKTATALAYFASELTA